MLGYRRRIVDRVHPIIEMELQGAGNGWSDVSRDVTDDPLTATYGMSGAAATDRVARTGDYSFGLNNSTFNSAGLLGYYSPNHANVRPGFRLGVGVRLRIEVGPKTIYKFSGRLQSITPIPGQFAERTVRCTALDWMDQAARYKITDLPVQTSQRSDQIFSLIVASMPVQPPAVEVSSLGLDTYPFALDNTRDEAVTALGEFQRLAASELGYIYTKGDAVRGGTLVFESRSKRGAVNASNVATFDDNSLVLVDAQRSRDDLVNRVQVVAHPRVVEPPASTSVLFRLQSVLQLGPGETKTVLGPFTDPNQRAARVGGIDMITPAATTDYLMNASADGTGVDLTAFLVVTPSANYSQGGNGVRAALKNTSPQVAHVTKFQCRGRGIFDFERAVMEAEDLTSQVEHGESVLTFDMPYQADAGVAFEAAQYLVNLYKDPFTHVQRASVFCKASDVGLAETLLVREISDRIGIVEQVTGLTTTIPGSTGVRGFYINGVDVAIDALNNLTVSWVLAPADATAYWLLEVPNNSELDLTTRPGFGLLVGHSDVTHCDEAHTDTAHADVAHSDVAHADQGHQDAGHDDVAHSDAAHSDSAHQDAAHQDTAHSDSAHVDSHSDSAHTDAHTDVAHCDVGHSDHDDGI